MLKEGNSRFVQNQMLNRDLRQQVNGTSNAQYPFAIILSCIDSRLPVEFVFDQGLGDIFCIRIAGNVINADVLGSMEIACKVVGAKLIVVMGHSSCGAIKHACDYEELGNFTGLLGKIQVAVNAITPDNCEGKNSKNTVFVQQVANKNVLLSIEQIRDRSPILRRLLESGKLKLAGAMYYVKSGKVDFFESLRADISFDYTELTKTDKYYALQ